MTALALIRPDLLDPLADVEGGQDVVGAGSHPVRSGPGGESGGQGIVGAASDPVRSGPGGESGGQGIVGAGSHPARTVPDPDLPTLEAALLALMRGDLRECLACGEPVEGDAVRVECPACGSVLAPAPREVIPGQLELLDC